MLQEAMHRRHTAMAAIIVRNKFFNRKTKMPEMFSEFVQRLIRKLGYRHKPANKMKAYSSLVFISIILLHHFRVYKNMVRSKRASYNNWNRTGMEWNGTEYY